MEVLYYPSFLRQLKKLPKTVREAAVEHTRLFMKNPHDPLLKTHKLTGRLRGYWAFSVDHRYRIIFEFEGARAVFHMIGDHSIYDD